METLNTIIDSIIGIVIGLLVIKYADKIASSLGSIVGTSIIRDTNNPWVFKTLGALLIIVSFIGFFL